MTDLESELSALRARITHCGNVAGIARAAGLNYYTVQRIATGRSVDPGILTCAKIARALPAVEEPQ